MKILVISTCVPDAESADQYGSSIWVKRILGRLLSIGDVTLLCPGPPPPSLQRIGRLETVITSDPPRRGRLNRALRSITTRTLPAMWESDSGIVRSLLSRSASSGYEVCVLIDDYAGIFLRDVPPELPAIFIRHNLFGRSLRATASSGPVARSRRAYHLWLADGFDRWTSRAATILMAGQTDLVVRLRSLAPSTPCVYMATLGAEVGGGPRAFRGTDAVRAVFLGNFAYGPNAEAAAWFVRDVLPELNHDVRDRYRFRFVGAHPPLELLAEVPTGCSLEFPGFVADLEQELAAADIGIVPLHLGDGVKTKTVTMMNAQLPIVSTSEGVRGLPVESGRDHLLADSATTFASSLALLLDAAERRRIGANAGETIRAYETDADPRGALLDAIAQAKARRPIRRGVGAGI